MRKVLQLVASDSTIAALCDDGSLWSFGWEKWERMPDIPRDDPPLADIEMNRDEQEAEQTWQDRVGLYGGHIDP